MTINLYSKSVKNEYEGLFATCDFNRNNDVNRNNETNHSKELFNTKSKHMNNEKLTSELKEILLSKFDGNLDQLAQALGVPSGEMIRFIDEESDPPLCIIEKLKKSGLIKSVDDICLGNKIIKGDNIVLKRGGMVKNYGEIDKLILNDGEGEMDKEEEIKMLNFEIKNLKRIIQDKEEVIKSKDETIEALKKKK